MAPLSSCQVCPPAEVLQASRVGPSKNALRTKQRHKSLVWNLASWNVRTLLDVEGSLETARSRAEIGIAEDRRIDQVVGELGRYGVVVAGLQETKWFGWEGVYGVGGSIVLAAGRPVPGGGQAKRRGEGVAIVLTGPAVHAWKDGGSLWKAWSPRVVSVTLVAGGSKGERFHVLSCYALTFAASREMKDQFYSTLQQALSSIPHRENFVLLGDFNARVGSWSVGNEWWYVRGPHGHGALNNAGRELIPGLRRRTYT